MSAFLGVNGSPVHPDAVAAALPGPDLLIGLVIGPFPVTDPLLHRHCACPASTRIAGAVNRARWQPCIRGTTRHRR